MFKLTIETKDGPDSKVFKTRKELREVVGVFLESYNLKTLKIEYDYKRDELKAEDFSYPKGTIGAEKQDIVEKVESLKNSLAKRHSTTIEEIDILIETLGKEK